MFNIATVFYSFIAVSFSRFIVFKFVEVESHVKNYSKIITYFTDFKMFAQHLL